MGRLYEPDAVLILNGIKKSNQVRICVLERVIVTSSFIQENKGEFFKQLPISEHRLSSLNVHPVAMGLKQLFLISTAGTVKFGMRGEFQLFNQNFVVAQIDNYLKIISDSVRLTVNFANV